MFVMKLAWIARLGIVVRQDGRIVIPVSLRKRCLDNIHSSHLGIVKSKQRACASVYWPSIDRDIESLVKVCVICQESDKSAKNITSGTIITSEFPEYPFHRLQVDITGPIAGAPYGYKYIIVALDEYSKWPEALFTDRITAVDVLRLIDTIGSRHGYPDIIKSDNGTQFTSAEFRAHIMGKGCDQFLRPVYSPKSTGAVERVIGTIKRLLKCSIRDGKLWNSAMLGVLGDLRSTRHSATGFSPFSVLSGGRQMPSTLPVLPINRQISESFDSEIRNNVAKYQDRYRREPSYVRTQITPLNKSYSAPKLVLAETRSTIRTEDGLYHKNTTSRTTIPPVSSETASEQEDLESTGTRI